MWIMYRIVTEIVTVCPQRSSSPNERKIQNSLRNMGLISTRWDWNG